MALPETGGLSPQLPDAIVQAHLADAGDSARVVVVLAEGLRRFTGAGDRDAARRGGIASREALDQEKLPVQPREPGPAAAARRPGTAGAEVASLEGNLRLPLPRSASRRDSAAGRPAGVSPGLSAPAGWRGSCGSFVVVIVRLPGPRSVVVPTVESGWVTRKVQFPRASTGPVADQLTAPEDSPAHHGRIGPQPPHPLLPEIATKARLTCLTARWAHAWGRPAPADDQSRILPADYALPVDGGFAAAEPRRMASYACRPCAIGEGWLCTAPEGALRSPPGGADLPAARVLQQPRDGVRQAG